MLPRIGLPKANLPKIVFDQGFRKVLQRILSQYDGVATQPTRIDESGNPKLGPKPIGAFSKLLIGALNGFSHGKTATSEKTPKTKYGARFGFGWSMIAAPSTMPNIAPTIPKRGSTSPMIVQLRRL
jgi:hypothetical protein